MNGLVEMAVVAAQQGEHMEREAMLPPKKRKRQTLCEAAEQSLGGLGGPAHPPIAAAGDCDSEDSREPAPRAGAKGKEARIVAKDGVAAEVEAADLALARALQEAENVRPAEAITLADGLSAPQAWLSLQCLRALPVDSDAARAGQREHRAALISHPRRVAQAHPAHPVRSKRKCAAKVPRLLPEQVVEVHGADGVMYFCMVLGKRRRERASARAYARTWLCPVCPQRPRRLGRRVGGVSGVRAEICSPRAPDSRMPCLLPGCRHRGRSRPR